jgi:energy-coupling factor transport system ATP-binding protein
MSSVTFSDVTYSYPDEPPSLRHIDLGVSDGDIVLVGGPAGSGKSTLLRAVNGLVPHSTGGTWSGTVTVGDRSTTEWRPRDLADAVGFVHQDPEAQFVVDRVEGDVAFSLENLGLSQESMRRRVEEVLDALDIAALRKRPVSSLSGGERQRVAIAGAIATGPAVLVLDEPTSQLDPQGADDVLAAVARLNADLGTTVVVAEHRLERAADLADRAILLDGGEAVADGPAADTLADYPGAPPVVQLARLLGWHPVPLTVREARRFVNGARPAGLPAIPPTPARPAVGEPLLTATDLDLAHGRTAVLESVSLTIRRGEVVAVLGRNGSGKTTLLRALTSLHRLRRGRLDAAGSTAYVPQDPNLLLFSPTVEEELRETLKLLGRRDKGEVERWLDRLGLTHLRSRHPRSLSSGQRQRVAIAAVGVGQPDVLVLDEPTRGMDAPSRDALRRAAIDHAADGGAVVLATHDVELAASCCTTVLVLGDGDIVAQGEAHEVLSGSLFAPQTLRILPPYVTVEQVATALTTSEAS